jgi:hypothetical protein
MFSRRVYEYNGIIYDFAQEDVRNIFDRNGKAECIGPGEVPFDKKCVSRRSWPIFSKNILQKYNKQMRCTKCVKTFYKAVANSNGSVKRKFDEIEFNISDNIVDFDMNLEIDEAKSEDLSAENNVHFKKQKTLDDCLMDLNETLDNLYNVGDPINLQKLCEIKNKLLVESIKIDNIIEKIELVDKYLDQ